jgi:hypothetical protein
MVLAWRFPDNGPIPTAPYIDPLRFLKFISLSEAIMLAILLILSAAGVFLGVRLTLEVLDIVPQSNDDLIFV